VDVKTEDERLLIEAAQADPARFVELYDRNVDRVYAYVSRRAGSRSVAEDVTSEVFEQALTNLRKFEWRGVPFVAWLFRIAANALADHWKRQGRDSQELPPDVADEREQQDIDRRLSLFQLVDRLPDAQRHVIQMRFVEDCSIREVAAALDRSEGAIKQLQLRAIDTLRKGLEERPKGVPGDREERPGHSGRRGHHG
jgi:RNA polymerase sigma-70 factor (ECF subfamily)